jgi:hypothetical protein
MLPLFDGGLRHAELQRSWSQYAQTRDDYRATVLAAFQVVEDGMSLTQRLATAVGEQQESSKQAAEALSTSTTLYRDGLDNYLSVSVAQVLAVELVEVQLRVRQVQASVSPIRALGGLRPTLKEREGKAGAYRRRTAVRRWRRWTINLQANSASWACRAEVIKLFASCRIGNIYFFNRYVARRSAPSPSREAQREWPKLQAGGPLAHELGDLRVQFRRDRRHRRRLCRPERRKARDTLNRRPSIRRT